jgi:hypothetical protein
MVHMKQILYQEQLYKGTVSLKFPNYPKKYSFKIETSIPANIEDLIKQISSQMDNRKRTFRHNKEPIKGYNLLKKILPKALDNIGIEYNIPNKEASKNLFYQKAHESNQNSLRNSEKIKCPECDGTGLSLKHKPVFLFRCPKCNGHGYIIKVNMTRVGIKFHDKLAIDLDYHDKEKLASALANLLLIFPDQKFSVFETKHGYWIIGSKIYPDLNGWLFDNCKILKHDLKPNDLRMYLHNLELYDVDTIGSDKDYATEFKKTNLYNCNFNIDLLFTIISIRRKNHTLRASKKYPNEPKITEVK